MTTQLLHRTKLSFQTLAVGVLWLCSVGVFAQKPDSSQKTKQNLLLLTKDTINLEDKYILSELEKVQYAKYSENLKGETVQKVLENQRLKTASLEQKLLTEQLKAEATRKQAEAERKQEEARRKQEIQKQQIKQLEINQLNQQVVLQNRTRNFLFMGLGLLSLLGLSLLWSNRQLKKRNKSIQNLSAENLLKEQEKQQILSTQNETLEHQVSQRTAELKASLHNLKITQNQLIQKEKLASLGELTAGIAHEIQNPLNFVNNFAEMSVELAQELKEEIEKTEIPEKDKEYIGEILHDLSQNQQKINHHGKRASSIVKGMLEHSRTVSGERTPTDINKLADEYLRLSYHGMRAKDKTDSAHRFNADYELIIDENLPLLNVVPQDMGRVLLNLINNAFYAAWQRAEGVEHGVNATPKVTVSTEKLPSSEGQGRPTLRWVEIRVQDNGTGIPDNIKEKIFQPFFTTKPTGEGTGLGLSLSYDIVTKGHNGTIEVESVEGEGATFIVKLPIEM